MHPRGLRCSSFKYRPYSQSSRLARGAPRPSRCDARLSPRAASVAPIRTESKYSGGPDEPQAFYKADQRPKTKDLRPETRDNYMNTVRWGIIGCGDVTEVKSGPGFQKAEGPRSSRSCGAIARRPRTTPAGTASRAYDARADDLIEDPDVDAVYVATPPSTHCELALRVRRGRQALPGREAHGDGPRRVPPDGGGVPQRRRCRSGSRTTAARFRDSCAFATCSPAAPSAA